MEVVLDALGLEQEEMSDHEVLMELDENCATLVSNDCLKILDKFLKHLSQDLKLNFIDCGKYILRNSLIDWEHFLESWGIVP